MSLSVGDVAPEFSLPDQDRQVVSLADLRGTPVLLVFYPFAFSRICTGELCQLRDELATYTDAGVRVLALSTDPAPTLKAWREQEGFDFALLSDFWPHGAVAQAYGVFNDRAGMAVRGTFLVDAEGRIVFTEVNGPGDAREQSGWKDAVAQLAA
ncbi:peroxiredoxin [Geodermatophilus sp. URMC 61]|uniref:peroxiredoxin n=1 Tax=Geodermatophilus sp. URMC 61 TaxID=3423411 RepID=UPI00406C21E5